jgi:8-oxo-dGTP pyrophosphatase MutT (NUDIX family)
MPPSSSKPIFANYSSDRLTIGAGVAIFHLASERVVVCYHTRDKYWFLPKGRRNANEQTGRAAEREGFEESGYRNRLLPLPIMHQQTDPDEGSVDFVVEPLWTQLMPVGSRSQYMCFWYAAETVPSEIEQSYSQPDSGRDAEVNQAFYRPPEPFPSGITIKQRISADVGVGEDGKQVVMEPVRHIGTGVDDDEAFYTSFLLPIAEARRKLKGSVMEDVIRRSWDSIQLRIEMEERASLASSS